MTPRQHFAEAVSTLNSTPKLKIVWLVSHTSEFDWITMHRTSLRMNLPFKVSNSCSTTIRQGEEASNQEMYKRRTSDSTASTDDSYGSSVSSTESSAALSPSLIHRQRARPNHWSQLMNMSLTGILRSPFVFESITKRHADRYNIRSTLNFIHNLKLKGDGEENVSCLIKLQSFTKKSTVSFCPTIEVYSYVQKGVSWTRE